VEADPAIAGTRGVLAFAIEFTTDDNDKVEVVTCLWDSRISEW
jgi:hypothetical protein